MSVVLLKQFLSNAFLSFFLKLVIKLTDCFSSTTCEVLKELRNSVTQRKKYRRPFPKRSCIKR